MGLFSPSKPNPPKTADKVWATHAECLRGVVTEALLAIKRSELPVLITYFDIAHQELTHFLDSSSVPCVVANAFTGRDAFHQKNMLVVMNAADTGSLKNNISKDTKLIFLFLGHYPLLATEDKILLTLSSDFPHAIISFCLSMEDPVFGLLGGEKFKPLFETMGMKKDECIEHAMVTKAIRRALEKVSESVTSEMKATSEQEWFTRNLKRS